MSRPSDELLFFDYNMEESEHLIGSGAYRVGEQEWPTQPADGSSSAFPFTATHIGPQTTDVFSGVSTTHAAVSPGLNAPSPDFDRLSPGSDSLYTSGSSPAVSALTNVPLFEYAPQQNLPSPYLNTYVSPASLQDSSSSGYEFNPWVNPGAETGTGAGYLRDNMRFSTSESMTLASLGAFTDPDFAATSEFSAAIQQVPYQQGSSGDRKDGPSSTKRARMTSQQDTAASRSPSTTAGRPLLAAGPTPGPSNPGNSGSQSKSKLRSASRSSKNVVHWPDETSDERKTRNAHNQVEKQYRNRLNAQFEGLLNALPDSLRSPAGHTGTNDSDMNVDLGERRLSKGDVLELATRYIRLLERDYRRLEQERDDLNRDVERLRAMFVNQGTSNSEGPGGGSMG